VKNEKWDNSSPYFDGETILCLIKAAKYLGYTQYKPLIKESVLAMAKTYTTDQWHIDPQSRLTKGFFQWSLMAYWEYQDAGWENSDLFRDYILSLSWWSIHINKIDEKKRNTSYAFEGLIFGYLVAKNNGNNAAASEILYIIDKVLYKLTTWQVGGPLEHENKFLIRTKPHKKSGIGGILNAKDFDNVRIDVVQHQMHAVLLALRYIYN
ncbi:MAG TPA: hypothetical protein VLB82_02555, partial [Thermodesulfobacteriota bacterium]|nr:hypothetical protein [Thermodesulfobacteriota bacterium]